VRPSVPRAKLLELIVSLPPCTVGMAACSGAHHWARLFAAHGHTVRLMAPKFVAPYRLSGKRGKNDAADAAAICEAVQRPNMPVVPVKSIDQQSRLMVHRARQGFVEQRTATLNRVRGLLSELGIVLPPKAATVKREAASPLEDLPGHANLVIGDLLSEIHRLDERSVRQFCAWLGLVPGQYSSGGKTRLGRITKAGDAFLRSLLVMGARAVLNAAPGKHDSISRWAVQLAERRGYWRAVAAIAAKNARLAWAALTKAERFVVPA